MSYQSQTAERAATTVIVVAVLTQTFFQKASWITSIVPTAVALGTLGLSRTSAAAISPLRLLHVTAHCNTHKSIIQYANKLI